MACKTPDGGSRPFLIPTAMVVCLLILSGCKQQATVASVQPQVSEATSPDREGLSERSMDLASLSLGSERRVGVYYNITPACPFPQHRAYSDTIIQPNHLGQQVMDDDVIAAYQDWKTNYLIPVDQDSAWPTMYRISFGRDNPQRTVSEGIGYGMLVMAVMAGADDKAQEYFNGLWRFARMHPSNVDARLTAWQVADGVKDDASAFDGDADMALALLLADQQWGSAGEFNYLADARSIVRALRESAIGPDSNLPMLGDWVDPFGDRYNQFSVRSSDFMPANFKAFALVDHPQAWQQVVEAVQTLTTQLQAEYAPATGLLPDFVVAEISASGTQVYQPAFASFLEGSHDGDYHYNAGRIPMRLGMDALLNGDQVSRRQLRKIAEFVADRIMTRGVDNIGSGFSLDGKAYGNYFSTFFAAPFAIALMVTPDYQPELNALYDAIATRRENYYEDSINLLSLLLLSGNFWLPGEHCES